MQGKYGTSMQSIEHRPPKRGKVCKDCGHFKYKTIGRKAGYVCEKKNKMMYYTSVCQCKHYINKGSI